MTSPTSLSNVRRAGAREWRGLAVLVLAVTLIGIDGTVLALAIPALTEALDPTTTQVLWVGDIYSFALAGLLITMGNLADRIGRKKLLLIGAVGFGVASIVAAFAPSAELLIVARALLGISGATLMPSTLSIIRSMFEDARQRTTAVAIWSAGATAGAALGPLVGGALLENFWWGSVFLINVPVMVLVLVGGIFWLPESRNPRRLPVDVLSAVLSFVTIVPVVYFIKAAVGGKLSALAIAMLVTGLVAGLVFIRRQRRMKHPMLETDLFRNPAFSGAVTSNLIAIFAFSGLLFFFSQYLQLVRGFSPILAGVAELPITVASMAVILVVGRLVGRLGRGRAISTGLMFAALGLGLLAVAEGLDGYTVIAVALAFVGLGIGIAGTVSTDAILSAVPKERAGAASSISETAYELGIALGIAVLGSVHASLYSSVAAQHIDGSGFALDPSATLASAQKALTGDGSAAALSLLEQLQHSFTTAMQYTSVIAALLIVVGAVVAWRMIPSTPVTETVEH